MKEAKHKRKHVLLRCITDYFKAHPIALIISAICTLISALGPIVAPLMIQKVTNLIATAIEKGSFVVVSKEFYECLVIMISAYVISLTGGFIYSQLTARYAQKYMHELRCRLFEHMQDLPIKYFDTHDKGEIMSTFTNDVDTIRQLLAQSITTVLICSVTFISVFVIMLFSSIYLTIIVILGTIAILLVTKFIGGKSAKNFTAQQHVLAKEEGYVEEMMNGLKVIKSFTHEEECKKEFEKHVTELQKVSTDAHKFANILMPILGNIGNFLYILVAVVATTLFIFEVPELTITGYHPNSFISIGVIVSFLPMVRQFTNNVSEVSNQINPIAMAIGGTSRVYELLDEEKEIDEGYVTLVMGKYDTKGNIVECNRKEHTLWAWKHPHTADGSITYTLLQGDIRMFDVDFGYVSDKIVLHDVSLYAKPGQKIAFVGATGAGKTTITNLINRFYDIADGKIRYDGININKIKKKDLRRSLGMVLQDTNLFSGTIMDNIRFGRLDATDEECIEAAKLANADSFITRLPQGYNTYIKGNGSSISQGQAQLLSIARAAVSGCPVMILDEATSSIDTRTEQIVLKGMQNLMKGRTVFLIAHRLSTIQDAEAIMVLEHGRIIERGTHEQLIDLHGYYYQLYTGVFELE
ncbi:MAG: ABC transporter ATP-binding protein [Bacilli bacterium]|jgi:ATP-binding cassette subfamily B protein